MAVQNGFVKPSGLIPDARIRIYPDASHGFLFQYPSEVAAEVNAFLAGDGGGD
jgi:pimeloyl-ACP methyl ester carboxylesterase